MNSNQQQILFATLSDTEAWIRIIGQGNCRISPSFKALFLDLTDRGSNHFVLDLEDCQGVDSTFIGVMAKLATQIKSSSKSSQFLIREANERVTKSISSLGIEALNQFVTAQKTPPPGDAIFHAFDKKTDSSIDSKIDVCKTSLEAHTTLCDLNEDNKKKFQHVLDFLNDDLSSTKDSR